MSARLDGLLTLVAELTYACPLRCAYCSNPLGLGRIPAALSAEEWTRVIGQASQLGAVQLHLTGGEPLLRRDLEAIVAAGRGEGFWVNLVTSGVPLDRERLLRLRDAGLDAVQVSIQDATGACAARIAGTNRHAEKLRAARWVRELDLHLTLNCVIHRENIDAIDEIVALAERLGAERLELANAQYLGWALLNRAALLPSRAQIDRARRVAADARARLAGRMEILFVLPDYLADRARACMGGWASSYVVVAPDGLAMPCHAARDLPIELWNVRTHALDRIWRECPGFSAFRGEDFLRAPCSGCEHRSADHGGCRCQAFALTGDATATDPACPRAPSHALVRLARSAAVERTLRLRSTLGGAER